MIDFPLDLAVNSGITAAVVGVFLLLPPNWLLAPTLRQRLLTGTWLGLASVAGMYWSVLAGLSPLAGALMLMSCRLPASTPLT